VQWAAIIPEGPLHPHDLIAGLVAGVLAGLLARRFSRWGPWIIVAAVAVTIETRYPGVATRGFAERPSRVFASLALPVSGVVGLLLIRFVNSAREVMFVALVANAVVWGLVADTEPAVIVGGVVGAALLCVGSTKASPATAVLVTLPAAAAIIGSVGRPSQLAPALVAAAAAGIVVVALVMGFEQRSQRAGTPVTVASGATSSTTTAPAPTTAS